MPLPFAPKRRDLKQVIALQALSLVVCGVTSWVYFLGGEDAAYNETEQSAYEYWVGACSVATNVWVYQALLFRASQLYFGVGLAGIHKGKFLGLTGVFGAAAALSMVVITNRKSAEHNEKFTHPWNLTQLIVGFFPNMVNAGVSAFDLWQRYKLNRQAQTLSTPAGKAKDKTPLLGAQTAQKTPNRAQAAIRKLEKAKACFLATTPTIDTESAESILKELLAQEQLDDYGKPDLHWFGKGVGALITVGSRPVFVIANFIAWHWGVSEIAKACVDSPNQPTVISFTTLFTLLAVTGPIAQSFLSGMVAANVLYFLGCKLTNSLSKQPTTLPPVLGTAYAIAHKNSNILAVSATIFISLFSYASNVNFVRDFLDDSVSSDIKWTAIILASAAAINNARIGAGFTNHIFEYFYRHKHAEDDKVKVLDTVDYYLDVLKTIAAGRSVDGIDSDTLLGSVEPNKSAAAIVPV